MVKIEMEYEGDLRCRAVHGPSQTALATDAPVDNQGRGESFSPTDLVATALGTCVVTTMAIMARTLGLELGPAKATVTKEMTPAPRRIARLAADIYMSQTFAADVRTKLERAAHTCPVHRSLHPEVEAPITIHWAE